MTLWKTQAGNFKTSKKVNVEFYLPEFSVTKMVTFKCHMYDYTEGRYNKILGRDLLTTLGSDLHFSDCIMIGDKGPYEGCL